MATYLISELAERAGVPATTLRYYEQAGLLAAARSANGYRRYSEDALDRLALIRAGRDLGLPLAQLRDLLTARDAGACADVRSRLRPLLAAQIAQAEARAATLTAAVARLQQALAATGPTPAPGPCHPTCGCLTSSPPGSDHTQASPPPGPTGTFSSDHTENARQPHQSQEQPAPHQTLAPIACTLDGGGQQARLAEWRDLLGQATARETVAGGVRVALPAALAGPVAGLAVAEQQCCPFFRFTLVFDGGEVQLAVQAPAGAGSLFAELTDEPGPAAPLYTV